MMKALYNEKGASLRIDILRDKDITDFISTHADVLNSSMQQANMSDVMRNRLEQSNWAFSGMKTFHELKEAFPSLIDDKGNRKSFEQFYNDVRSINETYNKNYLKAEYNFVQASAEMAGKWESFLKDKDRYNLQYRTAEDDKVRPEHAELNKITLPASDSFWDEFYPPNGWGCRCTVVQVRKSKFPVSNHNEAVRLGEQALGKDTKGMFRFNPGKEGKSVPKYNPYTISKCKNCDKGKFLKTDIADSELCEACILIHQIKSETLHPSISKNSINTARHHLSKWYKINLPESLVGKFKAKRFEINTSDKEIVIINKGFYEETISKYKDDPLYPLKLKYAQKAHIMMKSAIRNKNEVSIDHPNAIFKVYNYKDKCYDIEMKVKCNNDGNFLHILRVYKKR